MLPGSRARFLTVDRARTAVELGTVPSENRLASPLQTAAIAVQGRQDCERANGLGAAPRPLVPPRQLAPRRQQVRVRREQRRALVLHSCRDEQTADASIVPPRRTRSQPVTRVSSRRHWLAWGVGRVRCSSNSDDGPATRGDQLLALASLHPNEALVIILPEVASCQPAVDGVPEFSRQGR